MRSRARPGRADAPTPARSPLRRTAGLLGAALLLLGVAGCSQDVSAGERIDGDVAAQGYVSGDGSTTIVAQADRVAAPPLTGETLEGGTFALADHLGKVVVLNVWASWCAPCRAEADELAEVANEKADDDVVFVGLNTRDSAAPATAFVERFAIPYPNVVDTDGAKQLLFRDTLPPQAIPSTLVIDREGRVAARAIGEVDRSRLLGLIEPIEAEGS
ncbi:MAG: TlpA family protein disulfide reductase [Candidatus Nanopelagicales bacterium]|jgi:thiol-disulfide isomerase/thioredoxin|nr:TlpA family protein disulfide reductase [Candidatus Nanopelagicales bacterium]